MTMNERRKYIDKMWGRYREASKGEKAKLLDEIEVVNGMHLKSIIRILKGRLSRKKRERVYGVKVDDAIRIIAKSLDYPCGERLHPNLEWMAQHLTAHHELVISGETLKKLRQISLSTLKRILKRVGRSEPKLAYLKPKCSSNKRLQ